MFFYPHKELVALPSDFGYRFDDVSLVAADGVKLHAWLIYPTGNPIGTIYFLHGNAENISTHTRSVYWLVDEGYQVLALDYRGYGRSEGKPDVDEVLTDIDSGIAWLTRQIVAESPELPVYLLGQSLGAALAIRYLDLHPEQASQFNALVVEAAFSRYGLIGRQAAAKSPLTWAFQYPVQWFLPRRHDPADAIARLQGLPILIIHSRDDAIIPYMHGQALWEQTGRNSTFITARGAHIGAFQDAAVRRSVIDFLAAHAGR
jgi:alpha-beta hydrolase superfamily lysophospholipase